ncbi:MAG: hypothetical protein ACI4MS_05350 [Candidatus Coproplasma sp.]
MKKRYVIRVILIVVLAITSVIVPVMSVHISKKENANAIDSVYINCWQIDGFEGGKGSRKQFIEKTVQNLYKNEKTYCTVVSLTSDSARENIENGIIPDVISYPSGFYGIENLINSKDFAYKIWCRGCYCLLTLDTQSDFSDASSENTVINSGIDNKIDILSTLIGLSDAKSEEPLNAYVSLINGKYKYLLGSQRDVIRLTKRGLQYNVKQMTAYNDLYQNISILAKDSIKYQKCKKLAEELENSDVSSLGLFSLKNNKISDELILLSLNKFDYNIIGPSSITYMQSLTQAITDKDANKLKSILQ